jgi:hypothetical protein
MRWRMEATASRRNLDERAGCHRGSGEVFLRALIAASTSVCVAGAQGCGAEKHQLGLGLMLRWVSEGLLRWVLRPWKAAGGVAKHPLGLGWVLRWVLSSPFEVGLEAP